MTRSSSSSKRVEEIYPAARFRFGKNWADFLKRLTVPRIRLAEGSIASGLGIERLEGSTFLDIGSGSGLFSLAARRLGAQVTSFDYDEESVSCTQMLRDRYFPDDGGWIIRHGSVLDDQFMKELGTFDIVYSWGVLHHTGDMWRALTNAMARVNIGGSLFISLYNDLGEATDRWAAIKRRFNKLPPRIALAYAVALIGREEAKELFRYWRQGSPRSWLNNWLEYDRISGRGMSRWHDWIDWIGGYPYERVRVEPVVDFCARDGFSLTHLVSRANELGCNEFVFRRVAAAGVEVESVIPNSASMARRLGQRLPQPFESNGHGWTAKAPRLRRKSVASRLFLVRDDQILGEAEMTPDGRVRIGGAHDTLEELTRSVWHLLVAERTPLRTPYRHRRGKLYEASSTELQPLADSEDQPTHSNVFVFEDGRQLPMPHATHDDIAYFGGGRFSHWGTAIFFSSLDGTDPRTNGRAYTLLMPPQPLPPERSLAHRFGIELRPPFTRVPAGWTTSLVTPTGEGAIFLLRGDELIGEANRDDKGRIIVAPPDCAEEDLQDDTFWLVAGDQMELNGPFNHVRGNMWQITLSELSSIADGVGRDNVSPLYLFEDQRQLPFPHAVHDDIDQVGLGRFSHWGSVLFFSTSDGSDPNSSGRRYRVFVAREFESPR